MGILSSVKTFYQITCKKMDLQPIFQKWYRDFINTLYNVSVANTDHENYLVFLYHTSEKKLH